MYMCISIYNIMIWYDMYVVYTYTYVYTYFNIYTYTPLWRFFFPRASASFAFQVLVRQRVGLLQPCLGIHFWIQQEMGISRLNHQLKNPKMEIFLDFFSVSKSLGFSATFHHPKLWDFWGQLTLIRKTGDIMGRNQGRIWWFKESEPLYDMGLTGWIYYNYMDMLYGLTIFFLKHDIPLMYWYLINGILTGPCMGILNA